MSEVSIEAVESMIEAQFPGGFPDAFVNHRLRRGHAMEELVTDSGPLTQVHVQAARDHIDSGEILGVGNGTALKAIRATHHRLAQLLAGGMDEVQASVLCNYTRYRVSHLRQDPAFQELEAYYRGNVDIEFADFVSAAKELSMDLLGKLQQDLDENPEKFTTQQLIEAIKVLADRTGHAPVQKSVNVNVNADVGSRLNAARERLRTISNG